MADSGINITEGSGQIIDTRTESTNSNHRQVVVIGDPSTNAGVAPVDATYGVGVDVKRVSVPTTIYNGKKTVTTAGTRVTLASSQAVKSVVIKALVGNTGTIYVGDSSVASTNGFALSPGDSISLDIANLNTVNLDSSVNGEGVTYIATN